MEIEIRWGVKFADYALEVLSVFGFIGGERRVIYGRRVN